MTPQEIQLLTIVKIAHEDRQLTPAEQREIGSAINDGIVYRTRYRRIT